VCVCVCVAVCDGVCVSVKDSKLPRLQCGWVHVVWMCLCSMGRVMGVLVPLPGSFSRLKNTFSFQKGGKGSAVPGWVGWCLETQLNHL
jgi:hypothetical protein